MKDDFPIPVNVRKLARTEIFSWPLPASKVCHLSKYPAHKPEM